jgi:hypothetical protein
MSMHHSRSTVKEEQVGLLSIMSARPGVAVDRWGPWALAGNGSPHEFRSLLIAPELQSPHRRKTIDLSIISMNDRYIE